MLGAGWPRDGKMMKRKGEKEEKSDEEKIQERLAISTSEKRQGAGKHFQQNEISHHCLECEKIQNEVLCGMAVLERKTEEVRGMNTESERRR